MFIVFFSSYESIHNVIITIIYNVMFVIILLKHILMFQGNIIFYLNALIFFLCKISYLKFVKIIIWQFLRAYKCW